jgi:hypothetical protein
LRYITTPHACQLTGLSTERLREWTSRRALIPADVKPRRKGCPAKYTWQTVLILRLAVILREQFHIELQAHKSLFNSLRRELRTKSFIALGGQSVVLLGGDRWTLVEDAGGQFLADDVLALRLNAHLDALSASFAMPSPATVPGQFDLFPIQEVIGLTVKPVRRRASSKATVLRRRGSV